MSCREGRTGLATILLIPAIPGNEATQKGRLGPVATLQELFLCFLFCFVYFYHCMGVGRARPDPIKCHAGRGFSLIRSPLIWAHPNTEGFFPEEENCPNSHGRFTHEDGSQRQTPLHPEPPLPGVWRYVYRQVAQLGPCQWGFEYFLCK